MLDSELNRIRLILSTKFCRSVDIELVRNKEIFLNYVGATVKLGDRYIRANVALDDTEKKYMGKDLYIMKVADILAAILNTQLEN